VNTEGLKLTIYFGERDRVGDRFLSDELADIFVRNRVQTSLIIRGVQGFGVKHHLRTDRLLTLSEDLPLVAVAVDARERIDAALADVNHLGFGGLVTVERVRLMAGRVDPIEQLHEETKLTIYLGRHERVAGKLAYEEVVELMHARCIAGATVVLGVDGTARGERRRARFFAANARVPAMVIAVGDGSQLASLLPALVALVPEAVVTLERARVCKRDGSLLAEPRQLPATDPTGLGVWEKLMVYAGEQARSDGHPLHHQLVRSLRKSGAAGATSLRGIWGYHGDHRPHGDSFWQLRRRVPVVTVIVDTPERSKRWFELIDRLTTQTGLVTSEMVPAFRATGPDLYVGGLTLAQLDQRG
jgi:PII-like signaling protein